MGINDIQGRIAAIESRFGMAGQGSGLGGPGGVLGSTAGLTSTQTSSAGSLGADVGNSSFADALATLTGRRSGTTSGMGSVAELISSLNRTNGSTANSTPTAQASAAAVIAQAQRFLGVPYVWGGHSSQGMDCSGLVQTVFDKVGIRLPRVSRDQAKAGVAVASLAQAKPGDLLFFHRPVDHVGIYLGEGQMINAPHPGSSVRTEKVWGSLSGIRRVLPDTSPLPASGTDWPAPDLRVAGVPSRYAGLFTSAASKHGISADLLAAVAKVESNFNPNEVSHAGAQGLMQFMPGTAAGLGINPYDPAQAVDGAARLLSSYLTKYQGSVSLALAAYNAGPGAVQRFGGVPPYAETQAYIRHVTAAMG